MHISEPTMKILMTTDLHCQRRRCSPVSLVSDSIVYADIRRSSLERRRRTIVGLSKTLIFSPFGRHIFETSRNEANIIMWYYLVPFVFSLTTKYVTLNGHFTLNFHYYEQRF